MKAGIGGYDAIGGIDEINPIPAGIANGQQSVVFGDNPLQRSPRHREGRHGGPDTGRVDFDNRVALHGDKKIPDGIQGDTAGIGQAGGVGRHYFSIFVEGDHRAVFPGTAIQDINIVRGIQHHTHRFIDQIGGGNGQGPSLAGREVKVADGVVVAVGHE